MWFWGASPTEKLFDFLRKAQKFISLERDI